MTALTRFEIRYLKDRATYRLLFPDPEIRRRIDRSRAQAYFGPDVIVGYARWRANEYGTQIWRCFVLQTLPPEQRAIRIPGVSPGAEILLSTRGAIRSKQFLWHLDDLRKNGARPENLSAAFWRRIHLALLLGRDLHAPTTMQANAQAIRRKAIP